MELEYLLFIWVLIPYLKLLLCYSMRKIKGTNEGAQHEKQKRTPLKSVLIGSRVLVFGSIPYFGAYYYADLKTLWVSLGAIYLIFGVILLIVSVLTYVAEKYYSEEIEKYKGNLETKSKDTNYWPAWQTKALCLFQFIVLALWLYSWRHLIA
nr:putative integron gene cassette protein [uncultured bacterium]